MPANDSLIKCEISAQAQQNITQGTWLTYSLTNTSSEPIILLTWYTPLEGFMSNLFRIIDQQGDELLYQGPMVKRMLPSADDFIVIAPQKTVSTSINLQQAYQINLGKLLISLRPKLTQFKVNDELLSMKLCTNSSIMVEVIE